LEYGIVDELASVLVFESVEHPLAVLARCNDSGETQFGQVLRYGGWRLFDDIGQMTHRKLVIAQRKDYADASGISQHRKDFNR